jgi:hypothetical protein
LYSSPECGFGPRNSNFPVPNHGYAAHEPGLSFYCLNAVKLILSYLPNVRQLATGLFHYNDASINAVQGVVPT